MSGVVSPVETLLVGGGDAERADRGGVMPAMRQSWRVISTVEVLPLVPVTATAVSGNGAKNCAASRAKARRGSASAIWTAPSTVASGRATTAIAPAATAAGMKSSPLTRAPWKAPKTVPGATLRWSIAKPVTCASPSPPRQRADASVSAHSFIPSRLRGVARPAACRSVTSMSRLSSGITPSSGPIARDHAADDRRGVPGGGALEPSWRRCPAARRAWRSPHSAACPSGRRRRRSRRCACWS